MNDPDICPVDDVRAGSRSCGRAAIASAATARRFNDQERAACHPDVSRFCQTQLQINPNDVLGILGCLQANRPKISRACQQVLANHGQ